MFAVARQLENAMEVENLVRKHIMITAKDWADLETIRAATGQRSQSAAIRLLIAQWKKGKKK